MDDEYRKQYEAQGITNDVDAAFVHGEVGVDQFLAYSQGQGSVGQGHVGVRIPIERVPAELVAKPLEDTVQSETDGTFRDSIKEISLKGELTSLRKYIE